MSVMKIELLSPARDEVVAQLANIQKKYLELAREEHCEYFSDLEKRRELKRASTFPVPIVLEWSADGEYSGLFIVELDTEPDFSNIGGESRERGRGFAKGLRFECAESALSVGNLLVGQRYYWRVRAESEAGESVSEVGSFLTEDLAPRLLRVPGVANVRDLGGWRNIEGLRVRQGLVYRTGGLNDGASTTYYTREEMRDAGEEMRAEYEMRAERDERLEEAAASLERIRESARDEDEVSVDFGLEWTLYRVREEDFSHDAIESALRLLDSPPESLLGAKAESVALDADLSMTIAKPEGGYRLVVLHGFDSEREGFAHFGCAGKDTWCLWVNGSLMFDKLTPTIIGKRFVRPFRVGSYGLAAPVREGRNIIAVHLDSDESRVSWCFGGFPALPVVSRLTNMINNLRDARLQLWNYPKSFKRGEMRVTPGGADFLRREMGIRSVLDLRSANECRGMSASPLGEGVNWYHIPSRSYAVIESESGREAFKEVFEVLLNKENYPLLYHCALGRDRTGGVSFILNGLLGVSEEDLYLEWRVTDFKSSNVLLKEYFGKSFDFMRGSLEKYEGASVREKLESFIISLGFSMSDIEGLRRFLLE